MSPIALFSGNSLTRLASFLKETNGWLLLLLVGVTHNLLWVKLATVAVGLLAFLLRKNRKWMPPPLPFYFYLALPLVGVLGGWLTGSFQFAAYPYVLAYGGAQWLVSAAAFGLFFMEVAQSRKRAAENSLYAFTLLNLFASLYSLGHTMWESGSWWPYALAGSLQYGISTGDYIQGLFGGSSVVNAAVSALLVLYFTQKRNFSRAAVAMIPLWLCGSNLLFLLTLLFLFFQTVTQSCQRRRLVLFTLVLMGGYTAINYLNMPYLFGMSQGKAVSAPRPPVKTAGKSLYESLRSKPSVADRQRAAVVLGGVGVATAGAPLPDTLTMQNALNRIYGQPYFYMPAAATKIPLKAFALFQTLHYAAYHPQLLVFGAGMGNASSKLAMKVTGAGLHGRWPAGKAYVGAAFYAAHLQDLLYLFSLDASQHSIAHFPNNSYAQLLAEYGLAGVLLFFILYVRYFVRRMAYSSVRYGSLLLFVGLLLGTDYWLESISVLFVLEALLLVMLYHPSQKDAAA